jgi:hypothetical protein
LELHTPTSTISRLPVVTFAVGCNATLVATPRLETCWTKASAAAVPLAGVTGSEAAESALVPTALVALTLNV